MKKRKPFAVVGVILVTFIVWSFIDDHSFQTAPYSLPASPMIAYRITGDESDVRFFANDPNSIQGFAIVQRQVITDAELQKDVLSVLNGRLTYGLTNVRCFEPGIAIRLGDGPGEIDALICLTCKHIYFFRGGQVAYRNLNSTGVARIKALYARLFPGHTPDGSEGDTERIAASRDQERQKLEQELEARTSQPTTELSP